jgi:DDE superfamily endonuclease
MPRTAERKKIIQNLEELIIWKNFEISDDEDIEKELDDEFVDFIDMETPEELLALVHATRYLEPRAPVPKSRDWSENILPKYDDYRFRQTLRVSREAFEFILQNIKSHPVFQNNSSAKQFPIEYQLQIALFRFGRFGNSASLKDIERTFGVSEGTVINATRRVVEAILSLEDKYLRWYTVEESTEIKRRIYQMSGFPHCLGFLDGTTIVLAEKPVKDGEFYFNRKSEYGLNCQIVADLDARIRFFFCGYPASVHDSRCIGESDFCGSPEEFFDEREYVLGDSAYTLSSTILTPYKKPASLHPENAKFNQILSSMRVRVEHCIGILKNRFQSLKGMRQRISGRKSARQVVFWVKACAILHNMILELDGWDERNVDEGSIDDEQVFAVEAIDEEATITAWRETVKQQVLQHNS